ncbi:dienelactone hydrolase protein [Herbaspirillum seropedicae SmR1]|uniref:Dienelactone hydrolase protein n=1 Tax=Herbaspirillum seropedicae (strain SmR1) TaxID=757424 RepID=D8IZS5_HERSS|nr:dienelactone hydrolase protein [Herbaspirillum seropedicae SmR1]
MELPRISFPGAWGQQMRRHGLYTGKRHIMRIWGTPLATFCAAAFMLAASALTHAAPNSAPPAPLEARRVALTSVDGNGGKATSLYGVWIKARKSLNSKGPYPTVIALHGCGGLYSIVKDGRGGIHPASPGHGAGAHRCRLQRAVPGQLHPARPPLDLPGYRGPARDQRHEPSLRCAGCHALGHHPARRGRQAHRPAGLVAWRLHGAGFAEPGRDRRGGAQDPATRRRGLLSGLPSLRQAQRALQAGRAAADPHGRER